MTDENLIQLECRPQTLIAARYTNLPFPGLGPRQEVAFDLGVTALNAPLSLSGVVIQGYNDHQLLFEERRPARMLQAQTGEADLSIQPGYGLAVRAILIQIHAYETLTHLDVTVVVRRTDTGDNVQGRLQVPVRYHQQQTDLHFPVRGAWWAIQGNDWSDRHKQEVFSQPYAMDFVKLGADNRFFRGAGMALEEHNSWDQPVYAAAGGKVAYVIYDMPDLAPGAFPDPRMFRDDPRRLLGNAVAVSHANGEFSYYACLQQAGIAVRVGDMIKRGTLIGRVGNSGQSPGPHLHVHLMEGPNLFIDQGLPMQWSHFSAGGQFFQDPTTIPTRMIVFGPEDGDPAAQEATGSGESEA